MFNRLNNLIVIFVVIIASFAIVNFVLAVDLGTDYATNLGLGEEDPRVIAVNIVRIALTFIGIIAICIIIYAGFLWMTAAGSPEKIDKAKKTLIGAVIGLIIILSAWAIVTFIINRMAEVVTTGSVCTPECVAPAPKCCPGNFCCDATDSCCGPACCPAGFCCCSSVCQACPCNPPLAFMATAIQPPEAICPIAENTTIRNSVIRIYFSKPVDQASVDASTIVIQSSNTQCPVGALAPVSGDFTVNGKVVEFRPAAGTCPVNPCSADRCFGADSTIDINLPAGGVTTDGGSEGLAMAETSQFFTNDLIDCQDPTVSLNNDPQVCLGISNDLGSVSSDDSGVSQIEFSDSNGNAAFGGGPVVVPCPGSGVCGQSPADWTLPLGTATWLPTAPAYSAGINYTITATASDLDDNTDSNSQNFILRPAHCCNDTWDEAEGEEGVDCGGECAACSGAACGISFSETCAGDPDPNCDDNRCASGFCSCGNHPDGPLPDDSCQEKGYDVVVGDVCCVCENKPMIGWVTPMGGFCDDDINTPCQEDADCATACNTDTANGAIGNFVTIGGRNFGAVQGTVTFCGAGTCADGDEQTADWPNTVNAACSDTWTDNQIIIVVPAGAVEGPIEVEEATTGNNYSDQTGDTYGNFINDFVVNTIARPGLCLVNPDNGVLDDPFNLQGINFTGGVQEVLFGSAASNVLANNIQNWTNTSVDAQVSNIADGKTSVFVKVDIISNYLNFTKNPELVSGPYITSFEPTQGSEGQYVTIYGSGLGNTKGISTVHFGDELGPQANYNFPDVCADSVWGDNQIIIKVPTVADGNYTITMVIGGSDIINTDPGQFTVDSSLPLAPSLCKIQPIMGPNNSPVSLWGEYFGSEATGLVRFHLNHDQSGAAITFWGAEDDADKAETTVHQDAVSGPVRIVQAGLEGNGMNFTIGLCTEAPDPDAACGSDICCPVGSYEEGRCHATIDDCYITVTSSVYEWDFSTAGPTAVGDPCYVDLATTPFCSPTFPDCTAPQVCDPDTCTCQLPYTESCMGYGQGECADNLCPNSPGNCSPYAGGGTVIAGDCDDAECVSRFGAGYSYKIALNKCVDGVACDLSRIVLDGIGDPITAYCADYGGAGRWHIDTSVSCPTGWSGIGGNQCIEDMPAGACTFCASGICLDDGVGVCGIDQEICPVGSSCDDSLVGFWKFDEGSGNTAFDSSGNGNDGTLINMDPATDWVGGKYDTALEFDGVDDYVNIADNNSLDFGTGPFSVILWVKSNYNGTTSFISKGAGFDEHDDAGWGLSYAGSPERLYVLVGNGTTHIEYHTGLREITQWKQVGLMRDVDDKIYYIKDGNIIGTGKSLSGNVSNDIDLTFGKNNIYPDYLSGYIDEVAIYNRALSAEEILEHYQQGAGKYCLAQDTEVCECCCRIGMAAQDCCYPLDCAGDCGNDKTEVSLGNPDPGLFGYCTGCALAGTTQAEHDLACNCFGTSGKFCDSSDPDYPEGVCRDCAQLSTTGECSLHNTTCCTDNKQGDACRGGDGTLVASGYCAYYDCQVPPNEDLCAAANPVMNAAYSDISSCEAGCGAGTPPLPGLSCYDSDTGFCEIVCGTGYDCLGDTGCFDNDAMDPRGACPGGDMTCLCCCDPDPVYDKCSDINPVLTCTPDTDPCDGNERGLCCGCAQDDDCGDPNTIGCGFDGCCRSRPEVIENYPLDEDDAGYTPVVCRNTIIKATFDQKMDISSFSGKVIVVRDYGSGQCPEGTEFLVKEDARNKGKLARMLDRIKTFFKKIIKPISYLARAYTSPVPADHNYCAITGAVSGYNNAAGQGELVFSPSQLLDAGREYYVIIKGDSNIADNISEGILNNYDIGMNGPNTETFNARTYTNAHIWAFEVEGATVEGVTEDGLVGYWKFDEGSGGTAFDSSGNGNDGSLVNMDDSDWVGGKYGNALEFDGVDDYVDAGDYAGNVISTLSGPISVSLWFSWLGGPVDYIISSGGQTEAAIGFACSFQLGDNFRCSGHNGSIIYRLSNILPDLVYGKWYHLNLIYDSTTFSVYINGEFVKSTIGSDSSRTDGCTELHIGKPNDINAYYFNGSIDEVAIYNRALSTGEIAALYSQSAGQVCELDYVTVDPPSYLFTTAGDTQTFMAQAKTANGNDITGIAGIYDWSWSWSSDSTSVANVVMQTAPNEMFGDVTSQNVKDDKTYIRATATITEDEINNTVGQSKEGKAQVYVFLCENPWPPVDPLTGAWQPWIDSITNCSIPDAGCSDTRYDIYYCRDDGGAGTADDFPAILSGAGDTVIRGSSTAQNVLKELYYLREEAPVIAAAGLTVVNTPGAPTGGEVTADWPASPDAGDPNFAGYKLYWGTSSGNYDNHYDEGLDTHEVIGNAPGEILINNVTYYFTVTSYFTTGAESEFSNEVEILVTDSVAPDAPTGLTAIAGDEQIDLNWTASVSTDTVGYKVYYGTSAGVYGDSQDVGDVSGAVVTGLTNGQVYYFVVTAYDDYDNESGYSIEEDIMPFACDAFTYEDVEYNVIRIGEQCWMAENLNVGTYVDSIDTGLTHSDVSDNSIIEKYCYDNDTNNCDTYGGLYDWDEMMGYVETAGTQGICPSGWHIPTDAEQYELENYLKDDGETCDASRTNVWDCATTGTKLKSGGSSGFGALLAGNRNYTGSFNNLTSHGHFWSSSVSGSNAWRRYLNSTESRVHRNANDQAHGFSVRCLKD